MEKVCKSCGYKNDEDSKFCVMCGKKFSEEDDLKIHTNDMEKSMIDNQVPIREDCIAVSSEQNEITVKDEYNLYDILTKRNDVIYGIEFLKEEAKEGVISFEQILALCIVYDKCMSLYHSISRNFLTEEEKNNLENQKVLVQTRYEEVAYYVSSLSSRNTLKAIARSDHINKNDEDDLNIKDCYIFLDTFNRLNYYPKKEKTILIQRLNSYVKFFKNEYLNIIRSSYFKLILIICGRVLLMSCLVAFVINILDAEQVEGFLIMLGVIMYLYDSFKSFGVLNGIRIFLGEPIEDKIILAALGWKEVKITNKGAHLL
ncbi:zinc ribbon domain-containing protein [Veillonella magna]|uniref:zinc ribbon domain-containing protein n=1 Tax=Veillonella magna TaxID=464322 RepID=UPI0023F37AD9|nr:zinc ribbon domain-containing protein [Veillonella magna]